MKIAGVVIGCYEIPTQSPESDGTIAWDKTTLVTVEVKGGGQTGFGYTYDHRAAADLIRTSLVDVVEGSDPMDINRSWLAMVRAVRNIGRPGIASTAVAAVDMALWDLKARLLGLPMVKLLGQVRNSIPIYGSGGFTSYSIVQLQAQLAGWAERGIKMVKMKIGTRPSDDLDRVRAAREALGDFATGKVSLFVDANGAYSVKQALRFAELFADLGVSWFEEPVSSDDLAGLKFIRERAPAQMEIAAGEYGYDDMYFRSMLESGAVDILQADATRCLGITGFLSAAALCRAFGRPLSSHCAPSVHAHLGCATIPSVHLEYFHDHVRIEQILFEGALTPVDGHLIPDLSRPGLGIELKKRDAQKYAV